MMAVEQPQSPSLLRRSTSIFRRRSKQESSPRTLEISNPYTNPPPRKLQRRPAKDLQIKHISTPTPPPHMTSLNPKEHPRALPHALTYKLPRPKTPTPPPDPPLRHAHHALPPSPHVRTVPWNVFLTPSQVYTLILGFRPLEMQDKWFVYAEGPDHSGKCKVHFHRSWTGLKMAELFMVVDLKGEGAGKIVGIKWDGSEETNGMMEEEVKYMVEMVFESEPEDDLRCFDSASAASSSGTV
ncbi:hypothetical protein GRF29_8g923973 [Pseudopithomyces chartarum]|uniref:Uncharacterized protein n=1 Tax=Pseudopithomyces chartarum TaxID=1892770 RepID=A0AAN6M5S3_9PLEO|nr:hypothetical protein GRF29_8g923973 [Pseudopithomyces chartarum]